MELIPIKAYIQHHQKKYGEFNIDGPSAELGVFRHSRSNAYYNLDLEVEKEWLHPDVTKLRELQKTRREEAIRKNDEQKNNDR